MKRSFDHLLKCEAGYTSEIDHERQLNASNRLLSKVATLGHTIDSSNRTGLFDADKLESMFARNGVLAVTFKPPLQCKMSTEPDVTAVLVSGPPASKKARVSKKNAPRQ